MRTKEEVQERAAALRDVLLEKFLDAEEESIILDRLFKELEAVDRLDAYFRAWLDPAKRKDAWG